MLVTLFYFSVIMMLRFVLSSGPDKVTDLTDWCSNSRVIPVYLSSGSGASDKSVAMISNTKSFRCSVVFYVKVDNNIMVVLEYPDAKPHESICYEEQKASITVSDSSPEKSCRAFHVGTPYRKIFKENVFVHFRSGGDISTVKITATSMRDSENKKCNENNEIECIDQSKIYCMTITTLCDGNYNCGLVGLFDEDENKCKGKKLTIVVILSSVIMVLISLFLIVAILLRFVPPRKQPYISEFSETSLFDCGRETTALEINVHVVFPPQKNLRSQTNEYLLDRDSIMSLRRDSTETPTLDQTVHKRF